MKYSGVGLISKFPPKKTQFEFLSSGLLLFLAIEDSGDTVSDVLWKESADFLPKWGKVVTSLHSYSRAIYLHCCAARGHRGIQRLLKETTGCIDLRGQHRLRCSVVHGSILQGGEAWQGILGVVEEFAFREDGDRHREHTGEAGNAVATSALDVQVDDRFPEDDTKASGVKTICYQHFAPADGVHPIRNLLTAQQNFGG